MMLTARTPMWVAQTFLSAGSGDFPVASWMVHGEISPNHSRIEPLNQWPAGDLPKHQGRPTASPSPGGEGWGEGGRSRRSRGNEALTKVLSKATANVCSSAFTRPGAPFRRNRLKAELRTGRLLINFNVPNLKDGIQRVVYTNNNSNSDSWRSLRLGGLYF